MDRSESQDSLESDSLDYEIPTLEPGMVSESSVLNQHGVGCHESKGAREFKRLVPPDHLSTEKLVNVLYDTNSAFVDTLIELASKYDMVVSSTLKGWNGIDTKLCVKILHITCEWNSDRIRLPGRSDYVSLRGKVKPTLNPIDHVFLSYYQALWQHYRQCFTNNVCYITTVEKSRCRKT